MFDIFGNKKKRKLLDYIDMEIDVMQNVIAMYDVDLSNSSGDSPEHINHRMSIIQWKKEALAIIEELRRVRREIERIYS